MKRICLILLLPGLLASCVGSKKYKLLLADHQKLIESERTCSAGLRTAKSENDELRAQNKALASENEFMKKNSNQMLNTLQDMSVLSSKQAESIKQSLENLSEKDSYIKNLQIAMRNKDSLNLALVMNLKSSLDDINDKDINVKVEKGVVYIDISDKVLFNSGKYAVTQQARTILGKVAKVLNAHGDIEFTVEGHTDTIPIHNECVVDNWDLSVKRATSVVRILQTEYNINPARMTASGHAQYIPIASNNTADGRMVNRRTRIIILPQLDQFFKLMVKKDGPGKGETTGK